MSKNMNFLCCFQKHKDRWICILFKKLTSSLTLLTSPYSARLGIRLGSYPLPPCRRHHMLCSSVVVGECLHVTEHATQLFQSRLLLASFFNKMADRILFSAKTTGHILKQKKTKSVKNKK